MPSFSARVLGVMGDPIAHSLSPLIFECIAAHQKVPISYTKWNVTARDLNKTLDVLSSLDLVYGWNVTLPHKQSLLKRVSSSPDVTSLGAVNVVKKESGKLWGFNTDWVGIIKTFQEHRIPLKGKTVFILGAGGASRATCYALGKEGVAHVAIRNRTINRAQKLARDFNQLFPNTRFCVTQDTPLSDVYINSTSLGMVGSSVKVAFVIPDIVSKNTKPPVVFDLVYRPRMTPLLKHAKNKGYRVLGGIDMLIWQALEAWEIWFGPLRQPRVLKKMLEKQLTANLNRRN